jgi:hypothetical protein
MKKVIFFLFSILFVSQSFGQISLNYSFNRLNPLGLSISHTGENKLFLMYSWNNGSYYQSPGYESHSNTGIYQIGTWGNRKIGEIQTIDYNRNVQTFSVGYVVFKNDKTKVSLYGGPGIYSVKTTTTTWHLVTDDLGVLDNYVVRKWQTETRDNPLILTTGVFINHGMFSFGLGVNTPPKNSGAPFRTNFLIGMNLN